MGNIIILKTAQNVNNRINLADIGQELVAQSLAFGSSLHQTGNIDKFQLCRSHHPRFDNLGQFIQPGIGNGHPSGVRLNRTKGKIGRLRCNGLRQGIKQS